MTRSEHKQCKLTERHVAAVAAKKERQRIVRLIRRRAKAAANHTWYHPAFSLESLAKDIEVLK